MAVKSFSKKITYWALSSALVLTSFVTTYGNNNTSTANSFTANAMAPLCIRDWNQFQNDLGKAKSMGIDAISVDVWWGRVEGQGDNLFDFSYYDRVFSDIKKAGLDIVPIMSFHQCGGNVGDDYTCVLPDWVWTKYSSQSIEGQSLSSDNLKYKSSQGNSSKEYVALWADDEVKDEYIDFMNAFEDHFGDAYKNDIQEINVSGGPSGELRYPSYNSHDTGTGYPNKGALQCYSNLAQADFRNDMLEKYGNLASINRAWNCNLTSINQVTPPTNSEEFFNNHSYYESQYGKDLLEWYNGSLVEHGRNMLTYADEAFDGDFDNIKLGIKIPGVHWQMESTTPRAAEVCAGIVNSDFSQGNGYGYNPILEMLQEFGSAVDLHFTCLEMNDYSGNNASAPKKLVGYVGDSATQLGVEIKGENALSGGNDSPYFWDNIKEAINYHGYNGITILRLRDVVDGESYNYYKQLIQEIPKPIPGEKVSVNFKVSNAQTYWGQNVYVVGNIEQLGNWDANKAVKLSPSNYPTWQANISNIPANKTIEFKFIKKDNNGNVVWESGSNRTYTTSDHDGETYTGQWK